MEFGSHCECEARNASNTVATATDMEDSEVVKEIDSMTIEEYRAAILQALLDAKNEDGTPALSEKEATEALNGFE